MTTKEITLWEVKHRVKIPAIKKLVRKEQIQNELHPYHVNWNKLEVQASDIYKQAKQALKEIKKL